MVTVPIFRMDLCPRDPNPNPSTLVEMSHYGLITLSDFDTDTDSEPNRVNPSTSPCNMNIFCIVQCSHEVCSPESGNVIKSLAILPDVDGNVKHLSRCHRSDANNS